MTNTNRDTEFGPERVGASYFGLSFVEISEGKSASDFLVFAVLILCSQLFGWQTFKRVGASRKINRVYKLVLILSIVIQLSLFFILASIGLWIDSLYNGAIGQLSTDRKLFEIVLFVVLAVSINSLCSL